MCTIYTREIPAFGGISPALRGSDAFGAHLPLPSAVVNEIKKFGVPTAPHYSGACGAHSFKNFRRVMRIPNMSLVLKLDNGKVVSTQRKKKESLVTKPSLLKESLIIPE